MRKPVITCVGLGEILWDILPSGPRLGGAPANFTFHAKQMGLDAMAVSCVGNDERGDEALSILEQHHVKVKAFRSEHETGYVKAELNDRGVPTYTFALDTAYDHIPLNDELLEIARDTNVCCFGTLAQRQDGSSRKAITAFLEAMPENSVKVFDINLRSDFFTKEVILSGLKHCTVFKCNDDELPVICEMLGKEKLTPEAFDEVLRKEFNINTFIYTGGEVGSYTFVNGVSNYVPTPKVNAVDTVGAGDSFTATFVALSVQGVPQNLAHEMATRVAAFVCTQHGAMPVLNENLQGEVNSLLAEAAGRSA